MTVARQNLLPCLSIGKTDDYEFLRALLQIRVNARCCVGWLAARRMVVSADFTQMTKRLSRLALASMTDQ
jgi:hypothetical protein